MTEIDITWTDSFDGSYADQVRRAARRLRDSEDCSDDDKRRINEFVRWETHSGGESDDGAENTTIRNHLDYLRMLAERGDRPLAQHDGESLSKLLTDMKSGRHPAVKDEGINVRNYQKAARVFYRYHDDIGIDADPRHGDIDLDKPSVREVDPDDLLFPDEVEAMISHNHHRRDLAFFTLLLATGQRKEAIRTLRLKHVRDHGYGVDVKLNTEEGATKGASGQKPLLWAKPYLRDWVDNHPYKDDPEAALFPPHPDGRGTSNASEADLREPMARNGPYELLQRMKKRAGIEKRVAPHLIRKTAITRMVLEKIDEQTIKGMVGWSRDSSQFETYVRIAEDLQSDQYRDALGLPTSGDTPVIGRPRVNRCPECNDMVEEGEERCSNPTCGAPITHREALSDDSQARQQAMSDDAIVFENREELEECIGKILHGSFTEMDDQTPDEIDLSVDEEGAMTLASLGTDQVLDDD